jgi:hypothetical protein
MPEETKTPRYVLVPPLGGNDWWMVNDIQEGYAIVTVQARHPHSEEIARSAYRLITGGV